MVDWKSKKALVVGLASAGAVALAVTLPIGSQQAGEDYWMHCKGTQPARVCAEEAQPTTTVVETTVETTTVTETVTAPTTTEEPPALVRLSGTFAHSGCTGPATDPTTTCPNWEKIKAFEDWRNRPVDFCLDYMGGGQTTWGQWTDPPPWVDFWSGRCRLHLSPGMWPKTALESQTTFTLAAGARGDYDSHWVDLGKALVAQGQGDSIIRPGHEFTGNWYSYTVCTAYKSTTFSPTKAANYAAYYRRIVTAMRSVPGQNFKFEWNSANGVACSSSSTGTGGYKLAYPGDDFVDYIGRDFYDRCFSTVTGVCSDPVRRWDNQIVARADGLNDVAAFAEAHGKPLFFSEYGINDTASDGFGDNPYFIQKAREFFDAHPTAGESYFNVNSGDGFKHEIFPSTQFPNARQKYLALFGG